jgi:2-polyprenyl-3-methyl-5-hydroxy-6-metoxy-1,4-benzoquinol methylase
LEISWQLVEYAVEYGRRNGVEVDISVGNIEETDLGCEQFDAIIAKDTFEHVERWQEGMRRVYQALKPGGLFYFTSTNKFSVFPSGEYDYPLYGWLPNPWRFRLRIARQGPDIMKLGIDFNQFTHGQLRRFLRRVGFSRVLDRFDAKNVADFGGQNTPKGLALRLIRFLKPLKHGLLLFSPYTAFTCVK